MANWSKDERELTGLSLALIVIVIVICALIGGLK